MKDTKQTQGRDAATDDRRMALTRRNYIMLAIGFAVIILGFILMAGGGSDSAQEFDYSIFSWRRIVLAPILVVAGFAFEIFAILKRFDN